MSQRGLRMLVKVADGHWIVQCRACGKRSRQTFDRALDGHEYWRDHVRTDRHVKNADPNHFDEGDATEALLREIFSARDGGDA